MDKGAPDILELSKTPAGIDLLCDFADKFVSCLNAAHSSSTFDPNYTDPLCWRPPMRSHTSERLCDLADLVLRVQNHACSSRSSCQRDGKCRFNFPKPLLPVTQVIHDEARRCVRIHFEDMRDNDAVKNYNPSMLSTWCANMVIKIIENAYGAGEYTAAYINNADRTQFATEPHNKHWTSYPRGYLENDCLSVQRRPYLQCVKYVRKSRSTSCSTPFVFTENRVLFLK